MSDTPVIKIGLISGFESPHGLVAKNQYKGAQLAVDKVNAQGGVLGKKIELLPRDDQMQPALAALHTKELIGGEKVDLLTGTLSAHTATEVNRISVRAGVPFFGICQTSSITKAPDMGII